MWSRLASRIMLPLGECSVYSDLDLYGVQSIPWTEIFTTDATFAVHFSGLNEEIRNSQYGALKSKTLSSIALRVKICRVRMSIVRIPICVSTSG